MQSSVNTLKLDMRDNPDLQTAIGGLQPGDRCTLEFEVMVKANDEENFEATIESIAYENDADEESAEDSDESDKESGTVTPSSEEPVMVTMLAKSSKKKPSEDEPIEEDAG